MEDNVFPVRRVRLLVNPIAGYGLSKIIIPYIIYHLERQNIKYKIFVPESDTSINKYLCDLSDDEFVGFVGGDGTFHSILNNISDFSHPICAFPTGTGNAYAKELNLPRTTKKIVNLIMKGHYVEWLLGYDSISRIKFGLFCGAGFHSQVIKHFQINRKGPTLITSYIKWGLHCVKRETLPRICVTIDGNQVVNDTCWVEIFNVSHYGGPLRLLPFANPKDDYYNVIIFKGKTKRDVLRLLLTGFIRYLGNHNYCIKDIESYQGKNISISSPSKVPFHMDGDYKGYLPVEISPLVKRLKFIC
ncbi:MAG: NAD(+)/NADH kinase [Planctomycetes bacterium]|nr:NAD(+)/NADH kinase [Planctomycetota bacterium]